MANTITAGNATNNGLAVSSDNSGTLNILTGPGTGTTAISVDASQNAVFTGSVSATSVSVPAGPLITESMTLLGTLTTTSGTTQTLSGLNLTGYKFIYVVVADVSNASGSQAIMLNGINTGFASGGVGLSAWGVLTVHLITGAFSETFGTGTTGAASASTGGSAQGGKLTVTNATTSLAFTFSSGASFDAGTITIYGVK